MVGLEVSVEYGDDRCALGVGARDVLIDEIDVRIDDRKLAVGLAPEQVGSARGCVVQELSEVHAERLFRCSLDKLSNDLLNSKDGLATRQGGALRGDRADGKGVHQSPPPGAAR